jgi:hypothetical protein
MAKPAGLQIGVTIPVSPDQPHLGACGNKVAKEGGTVRICASDEERLRLTIFRGAAVASRKEMRIEGKRKIANISTSESAEVRDVTAAWGKDDVILR